MTTLIVILGAVSIAASPLAYFCGRRSAVEDRRWDKETTLPPLPPVRDTLASDREEAGNG